LLANFPTHSFFAKEYLVQIRQDSYYDPNDSVQARIIKKKIRKLPGFNLYNANIVCFIAFTIDIAIAFTNTPILKSNIDLTTLILTSAYDQININNIGVLFLLVAGMTINAIAFELFSSGSKMIDKKSVSNRHDPQRDGFQPIQQSIKNGDKKLN
jgi:hypothetical protein